MSAVAKIGEALGYDAAERAIMVPGGFARAAALAALAAAARETNDDSPMTTLPTEYPATVRPGKR